MTTFRRRCKRGTSALLAGIALGSITVAVEVRPALACSTLVFPGETQAQIDARFLSEADLVFEGVAATSEEVVTGPAPAPTVGLESHTEWVFNVTRVLKGQADDSTKISADYRTKLPDGSSGGSSCNIAFQAGHRYMIFAKATGTGFRVDGGSGTRELLTPPTAPPPASPVPGRPQFTG